MHRPVAGMATVRSRRQKRRKRTGKPAGAQRTTDAIARRNAQKVGKSTYDPEVVDAVLEKVRLGWSLLRALKAHGVSITKFYVWLNDTRSESDSVRDGLRSKYSRACAERVDNWAEQIVDISDSRENDVTTDERGRPVIAHDVINRDRLRVDTRKWLMSRMNPKKWGDKLSLGGDEDNPLRVALESARDTLSDKLSRLEQKGEST